MRKDELDNERNQRDEEIANVNKDQFLFLTGALLALIALAVVKIVLPDKTEISNVAFLVFTFIVCMLGLFGWLIQRSGAYKLGLEKSLSKFYKNNGGEIMGPKDIDFPYWEEWKDRTNYLTGIINGFAMLPMTLILVWLMGVPIFSYLGSWFYLVSGVPLLAGLASLIFIPRWIRSTIKVD